MRRQYADRAIATFEIGEILSPIGLKEIPESQARELAPLRDDPERMRRACAYGHTGRVVRRSRGSSTQGDQWQTMS